VSRLRFTRPPRALRRRGVKLDNLALVSGSLLPAKARWQALANDLPPGAILICLPSEPSRQRRVLEIVARQLSIKGHRVRTVAAEQFAPA
jgi:hypothetical protein